MMLEFNSYNDFQFTPVNTGDVLDPQFQDAEVNNIQLNYGYNAYNFSSPHSSGLEMNSLQFLGVSQSNSDDYFKKSYYNEPVILNPEEAQHFNGSREIYNFNEFDSAFNYPNTMNNQSSLFSYSATESIPNNYRYFGPQFETDSDSSASSSVSYNNENSAEQNFSSFTQQQIPNFTYQSDHNQVKIEEQNQLMHFNRDVNNFKRYKVVRGVSAGGCSTRPPKESIESNSIYLPVELELNDASLKLMCYPKWSSAEIEDKRRIIRIERIQSGPKLMANFSILGAAKDNMTTAPAAPNVDVVEVSCLRCLANLNEDIYSSDDESKTANYSSNYSGSSEVYNYYITSVEVLGIVELLIGTKSNDPAERRREKGRIRSNLVPFWSKKPISSRMNESSSSSPSSPINQDYRMELAKRIMGYEIRKPRGFDKEVRILRWDKLVPALKRALQSYYTEIPQNDSKLNF